MCSIHNLIHFGIYIYNVTARSAYGKETGSTDDPF